MQARYIFFLSIEPLKYLVQLPHYVNRKAVEVDCISKIKVYVFLNFAKYDVKINKDKC